MLKSDDWNTLLSVLKQQGLEPEPGGWRAPGLQPEPGSWAGRQAGLQPESRPGGVAPGGGYGALVGNLLTPLGPWRKGMPRPVKAGGIAPLAGATASSGGVIPGLTPDPRPASGIRDPGLTPEAPPANKGRAPGLTPEARPNWPNLGQAQPLGGPVVDLSKYGW